MKLIPARVFPVQIQSRLTNQAGIFIFLSSLILTIAPAVRELSWAVENRWSHWLGFVV